MSDEAETGGQKRVHMTMRLAPSLRSRLEKAAAENGRSLTQEVESRLSQSFDTAQAVDQAVKAAFEYTLGGQNAQTVAMMFATTVRIVESREKKSFGHDPVVNIIVIEAIRYILRELFNNDESEGPIINPHSIDRLGDEAIFVAKLVLALLRKENSAISRQMEEFFSQPHHK